MTHGVYRITGIHLLIISGKTTSSDAILPISLKIALDERTIKHTRTQNNNIEVSQFVYP